MTQRIGDLVEWVDPRELRGRLRARADQYLDFLKAIRATRERTEVNLVIFNIARAAGIQIERLHLWLDQGADSLAWCARNLFELDLILRFVLASEQNLRQWVGQRAADEIELIDAMLEWASQESAATSELRSRRVEVERIAHKHGVPLTRFRSVRDLARSVGSEEEYHAVFKLLSKHVHPSSYLVNEDSRALHGWDSINMFLTLAQLYAADIEQRIRGELGL